MSAAARRPAVPARPAVAWGWGDAAFGAICAVPAAVMALSDVPRGLAFAFGVLPAAIVGVAPRRARRGAVVLVGLMMGLSIFVGSLLAPVPPVAVAAVFVLAVGAASLAQHRRIGMLVMTLALPLVGVGFSYTDRATTAGLAVLLTLGSAFAAAVSLAWPERTPPPAPPARPLPSLSGYGVRLGLAGAIAAAIGFAADWDHAGWACAACLLVMRPAPDLVTSRGAGRILSVLAGALVGVLLANATDSGGVYAVVILTVVAAASATHASRWYVTSAFTTFLVLSLLAYGASRGSATGPFNERLVETAVGVLLALVFGTVIPRVAARGRPRAA